MSKMPGIIFAVALAGLILPPTGRGADQCPAELTQAKAALNSAQAAQKSASKTAKSQEIQAPRALAGARAQELQAPRAQQDIQAPRAQELQAPRAQDIQAPRTRAGARSPDVQTERINKASVLIREGDAACKKGDMTLATEKAKEALTVLKQV